MRIFDRIVCFVNCHFAAHLEAVNRRNADFDHVYRTMIFSRPSNILNSTVGMVLLAVFLLPCRFFFFFYLFSYLDFLNADLFLSHTGFLSASAGASSAVHMLHGANVCKFSVGITDLDNKLKSVRI